MQGQSNVILSAERFAARLRPAPTFAEAAASIQAALDDLRRAETALERQIDELRSYMRDGGRGRPAA
ncbi:MAG TPA: hypothetical protein VIL72_10480 [Beijerinckiaceae bacterium]|jgi:cell division protein FtsB